MIRRDLAAFQAAACFQISIWLAHKCKASQIIQTIMRQSMRGIALQINKFSSRWLEAMSTVNSKVTSTLERRTWINYKGKCNNLPSNSRETEIPQSLRSSLSIWTIASNNSETRPEMRMMRWPRLSPHHWLSQWKLSKEAQMVQIIIIITTKTWMSGATLESIMRMLS